MSQYFFDSLKEGSETANVSKVALQLPTPGVENAAPTPLFEIKFGEGLTRQKAFQECWNVNKTLCLEQPITYGQSVIADLLDLQWFERGLEIGHHFAQYERFVFNGGLGFLILSSYMIVNHWDLPRSFFIDFLLCLNFAYACCCAEVHNSLMHALNGNLDNVEKTIDSAHKFFLIRGRRVYCILCPDGKFKPYLGDYCEDYVDPSVEGIVVSVANDKRFWMNLRWFSCHKSNICGKPLRDCKTCFWMKAKGLAQALDPADVSKFQRDAHVYTVEDLYRIEEVDAQSSREMEAHEIFEYLKKKELSRLNVVGVRKKKDKKKTFKDKRQTGRDIKEAKAQFGLTVEKTEALSKEFIKWIPYIQFLRALVNKDWFGLLLAIPLVVGSDGLLDFYFSVLEIINPDDERCFQWKFVRRADANIGLDELKEKLSALNGFSGAIASRVAKLSILPVLKVVFQMDNESIAKFYTLAEPLINSIKVIGTVGEAIEIVGDLVDGIMPALITGDISLIKIETGVVRWIKETLDLKAAYLSANSDEHLLEEHYISQKSKMSRYASDKIYGMAILKMGADLDMARKTHASQKLVGSQRATPFACAIVGSPGTGKTFLTRTLASSFMLSKGKRLGEKDIYIWANAKFANGYTNQPVILLDDIGNLLPDKMKDAPSLSIHEMINSVVPMAPKASIEEKQTTPLVADMYIATSNDWNMGFQFQYTTLESCYRRFPLKIFLTVKEHYCLPDSKELDNSKIVTDTDKMVCQNFTVFEWSGTSYVQKLTYFDLPSFLDYFERYVQDFHAKQNRVLQGHVLCAEHGLPAIGCARCYKGGRIDPVSNYITNIGNLNLSEGRLQPVNDYKTNRPQLRIRRMPGPEQLMQQPLPNIDELFPAVEEAQAQIGFIDRIKDIFSKTWDRCNQGLDDLNSGVKLLGSLNEKIDNLEKTWKTVYQIIGSAIASYIGYMFVKAAALTTFHVLFKTLRFVVGQGAGFSDMSIQGAKHYVPSFNGLPETIRPGLNDPDVEKRLLVSTYDLVLTSETGKIGHVAGIAIQGDLILTVAHFFQHGVDHCVLINGEKFPLEKPQWFGNGRDIAVARCPGLPVRHQTIEGLLSKSNILSAGFINYLDRDGWHKTRDGFTEHVKSNLDSKSYEVLSYPGKNYDGMCGNPVLVDISGKWVLYGIHNFGSTLNHACRFDSNDLQVITQIYNKVSSMPTVAQGGIKILSADKDLLMRRGVGHLIFAHCEGLVQYANKRGTDFKATPYRQAIVQAGFAQFEPANSTGKMVNGEYTHPGLTTAWKYTAPSSRLSQLEVAKVVKCLFMPYLRKNLTYYSVLGNTEALTGIYQTKGMTGLNMSTSGGYGFPGGKGAWLVKDHTGSKISKMLSSILEEQESIMRTGVAIKYQCIANAKDELLKIEKIEKNKFRIFQVMPQTCIILARKALLSIIGQFSSRPTETYIGIGSNCLGRDWDDIANYLAKHDKVWCADVSGWDTSLTVLPDVCDALLDRLAELGVAGEDYNFVKSAFGSLNQFFTTSLGVSLSASKGMVSGHPFTAMGNSLCHVFLLMVCAYRGGITTYEEFDKNISCIVYGDDSVVSTSNTNYINPTIHTQVFAEAGMELQREDKKDGPIEYCKLEDATFLKRKFKRFGKIWLAPLDLQSIGKSLQYIRKGPVANIERVCAENSLKELVFHGVETFQRVHKILSTWYTDLPDYDVLWQDYLNNREGYSTWDTQFKSIEDI